MTDTEIETLAREIATVCFAHGIFLNGCGCCGTCTYKGLDFDHLNISEDGAVEGSALVPNETNTVYNRVNFKFKVGL